MVYHLNYTTVSIRTKNVLNRLGGYLFSVGWVSSVCCTLVELGEHGRLSASMKKLEKMIKNGDKYQNEQYRAKLQKSDERSLALIKAGMDIVVADLLQLAPKKVNPRATGSLDLLLPSSLVTSCFLLGQSPRRHELFYVSLHCQLNNLLELYALKCKLV
ncbi:hypothetical protein SLA2020_188120 [Shorea laevis]